MDLEQHRWDHFKRDLGFWKKAYETYSRPARQGKLVAVLALKQHILLGKKNYLSYEEEEKRNYFVETLSELEKDYTPDTDLKKLEATLICIDLNPESHLYLIFGKCMCGFYLGLEEEPATTRLRNKKTGGYEDRESLIVMKIGYPDPSSIVKVTFHDLNEISTFT